MSRQPSPSDSSAKPSSVWAAYFFSWCSAWENFWFTPRRAETLGLIRICCGAMLAYIHVIWTSQIDNFMGPNAWINGETIRKFHSQDWAWSWLFSIDHLGLLYAHQAIAIVASLCMAFGFYTKIAIPVAWWLTLMVCHRMTGALFGLDQIVMMLAFYLMWSRCGSVWSFDAKLARRRGTNWVRPAPAPAVSNNIATRLIQLHLCVIYLFGGLGKMRGEMWWDGSAMWFSIVNFEYQSLDVTWLGHFPFLIGLISAVTVFWETFYCALVWPKLTRPLALGIALLVHGGICIALGMWTFGTMMIVANMVFISPEYFGQIVHRSTSSESSL